MEIRVKDYLDDTGVEYKSSGKNVGPNDVAIDCPWCGASKHLTIHRLRGMLNCWVCNFDDMEKRPWFVDLIMELEQVGYREARRILREYSEAHIIPELETWTRPKKTYLPGGSIKFDEPKDSFSKACRDMAYSYLKSRAFGMAEINRYKLRYTPIGDDREDGRIIVPFYSNGDLITWLGRDYTNVNPLRYYNCPVQKSSGRIRENLYGYDTFTGKRLYLVEGVFDKWRMEDIAMALLRSDLSRGQLLRLANLKVDEATVILDRDGWARAVKIAQDISPFISRLKVIKLPDSRDPAEHTKSGLLAIEKATPLFIP